jgi:hypothetical protein
MKAQDCCLAPLLGGLRCWGDARLDKRNPRVLFIKTTVFLALSDHWCQFLWVGPCTLWLILMGARPQEPPGYGMSLVQGPN